MHDDLFAFFPGLLERHVPKLVRRGDRIRGCCPLHGGNNPQAFTANLALGAWRCMSCGKQGNIVAFARAVGEPLPQHRAQAPSPVQHIRRSIAAEVEAEYRAWKDERYADAMLRIAEKQSIIESLRRLHDQEAHEDDQVFIGIHIAEQYDDIMMLTYLLDRYSPNPHGDEREVQQEWIEGEQ